MDKNKKISGIVLHSRPLFEHDKLVEIFTPCTGKQQILAKYASTKKFKYGGKLEPGNIISCNLYQAKTFHILTQCDLLQTFHHIRESFNKISIAQYLMTIIKYATDYQQHNEDLYLLLKTSLETLNEPGTSIDLIKSQFHLKFAHIEGILAPQVQNITDQQFQVIYQNYANKVLPQPILILTKDPHTV